MDEPDVAEPDADVPLDEGDAAEPDVDVPPAEGGPGGKDDVPVHPPAARTSMRLKERKDRSAKAKSSNPRYVYNTATIPAKSTYNTLPNHLT